MRNETRYYAVDDPAAKSIGKKLKKLLKIRGIDQETMARQAGIHPDVLEDYIHAKALPTPGHAERLLRWACEGVDFSDQPTRVPASRWDPTPQWRQLALRLPPDTLELARQRAKHLGCSLSAYIQMAVERLNGHEAVLSTLKDAMDVVTRARLMEYLREVPAIATLLRADDELVRKMGIALKPSAQSPLDHPTPQAALVQLDVRDGPVSPVSLPRRNADDAFDLVEQVW